jgi:hypothetical protein
MDPAAINYEPNATIQYPTDCCYESSQYYTFTASVPLNVYASDASATINLLATYPAANGFCLGETCYSLYIQAIPSQQAEFSITGPDGNILAEGITDEFGFYTITISNGGISGCMDPNACNFDANATCSDSYSCNYDCQGCTDPLAPNYDPSALIDDGSCCTQENWATITTNVNAYIHIWGVNNGFDGSAQTIANVPYGICLSDACYFYEIFGSDPALTTTVVIERNGTVYLDASNIFTNSTGNFNINAISGCPDPNACNYNPENTCPDWLACNYDCQGCTDPTADNYNPEALFDNGTCCYNQYTVQVDGISYWYISNSTTYYADDNGGNNVCIADGCYYISLYTEIPNSPFSVTNAEGNSIVEGSTDETGYAVVEFGENTIPGCLDPYACNFDPEANCMDYSLCNYGCYGCTDPSAPNYSTEAIYDNGSCCYNNYYTVEMSSDSYWSAYSLVTNTYSYFSGIFPTNNWFCIEDGCFQFSVYNYFFQPTTFTIYNADGSIFYSGSTDEFGNATVTFNDGEIYGCTDVNACNYDPTATCSDWYACSYDCYGCTDSNAPNYNPDATIDNGTCCTNDWYTVEMSGPGFFNSYNTNYYYNSAGNYPGTTGFCQQGSCFAFQVFSNSFETIDFTVTNAAGEIVLQGSTDETGYYIGSIGMNNEIAGCTDMNACNYDPQATCNSGLCEYYCGGCTDPTAINYNAYAWYDDGSCFFTTEPPMMQLFVDSFEEQEHYFVRLDMMSLGNGAPYIMSNDINTEMMMVESNGQYVAGPFPCGENVSIKLNSAEYGMMEYLVSDPLNGACSTVSIKENEPNTTFNAFPNPSNGQFAINGIPAGNWTMQVMDVMGRIVLSSNFISTGNTANLEMNTLAVGQYQLIFTNETQTLTTKIVISQ